MSDPDLDNLRAFGFDPIAHMNAARARKPARGGSRQKPARPRLVHTYSPIERAVLGMAAAWTFDRETALEQYRFEVDHLKWEGVADDSEIPF